MKHLALLSIVLLAGCGYEQPTRLDVYLLIGQSNMAGRGVVTDSSEVEGVFALDEDAFWKPAKHPIHFDKKQAGVGPGLAFAKAIKGDAPVGLVPCAVGGSSIDEWEPGGQLYARAVGRTKAALKRGRLRGILWHQGETDAKKKDASQYREKLAALIDSLRKDLDDVPFVAGELGDFLDPAVYPSAPAINEALRSGTTCVSADGLVDMGDGVHFDSASADVLGGRYAAAFSSPTK